MMGGVVGGVEGYSVIGDKDEPVALALVKASVGRE
jgi:hypothetical protein